MLRIVGRTKSGDITEVYHSSGGGGELPDIGLEVDGPKQDV
jgi:hypothetical protein